MRGHILAALLAAYGGIALAADVDHKRVLGADSEPGQWFTVGRGYDEQRYSPLTRINTDNVSQLGLAGTPTSTPIAARKPRRWSSMARCMSPLHGARCMHSMPGPASRCGILIRGWRARRGSRAAAMS